MGPVERAAELLRQTEVEMRRVVSDAATAGDYASVVQVAALARSLREILEPAAEKRKAPATETARRSAARQKAPSPRRSHATSRRKDGYPRFVRQGDRFVRIAWSKRDKREYEQKAPFTVLKALTESMAHTGSDGRVFSTDELLPIRDEDGEEVPSYQVYAALGLLKQVGLVDQHGRQGYSIPRLPELKRAVESIWRNLPEK